MVYGISFLLAGIWLAWGQGHTHLSAWKKMSEEEKAKIKIIPLSRNIGEVITLNGVIFFAERHLSGLYRSLVYRRHPCMDAGCRVGCSLHRQKRALSQPMIRTAVVYRYQEKQEVRI